MWAFDIMNRETGGWTIFFMSGSCNRSQPSSFPNMLLVFLHVDTFIMSFFTPQLEDLKASIANGGTGKAEAKVEAYPTQQQSGSSAASGRNSHAGGGTLPGQAHEGVLTGTSLSGCRSPLDTHDLLTALPSSQHVLRNRDAGNAPFFMSAGQVNVSLPECFPGQAFTGGAANIGGNDSRGIGGQVQQSSQTSSQASRGFHYWGCFTFFLYDM